MKQILFTFLIALGLAACQPEKVVVWDNPSAITSIHGPSHKVLKVELKETETILHLNVCNYSHGYLTFFKEAKLRTDDGQEYALIGGAKTCEEEIDIQPDSVFRTENSGYTRVALHFQPVPLDTRRIHMSNGEKWGALQIKNICNAANYVEPEWPSEWKNIQYDNNETLPPAKLNEGVAILKVKMLDYHPNMNWSIVVSNFQLFNPDGYSFRRFYFDDEGNITAEIPMEMAEEVEIRIRNIMDNFIVIAPGQETEILLKAVEDSTGLLAFKGYMAKTNTELVQENNSYKDCFLRYNIMDSLENCYTPEERIQCLKLLLDKRIAEIQSADYTPAAKELLCIAAEHEYMSWCNNYGTRYSHYLRDLGHVKFNSSLWAKLCAISDDLLPWNTPNPHTIKYLDRPTAPISHCFWNMSYRTEKAVNKSKCPYIWELLATYRLLSYNNNNLTPDKIAQIKDNGCKKILQDYVAKKRQTSDLLQQLPNVYYKTYDNVAPRDMFKILLGKHKNKAIVVYLWKDFHYSDKECLKAIEDFNKELKDKDIPFIYITAPYTSPEEWYETIKEMPGEHYYLTERQFNYLLKRYGTDGIPTVVIYDKEGNRAYQSVGQLGLNPIKKALEEVQK